MSKYKTVALRRLLRNSIRGRYPYGAAMERRRPEVLFGYTVLRPLLGFVVRILIRNYDPSLEAEAIYTT